MNANGGGDGSNGGVDLLHAAFGAHLQRGKSSDATVGNNFAARARQRPARLCAARVDAETEQLSAHCTLAKSASVNVARSLSMPN